MGKIRERVRMTVSAMRIRKRVCGSTLQDLLTPQVSQENERWIVFSIDSIWIPRIHHHSGEGLIMPVI
jgi:hypothetical protein